MGKAGPSDVEDYIEAFDEPAVRAALAELRAAIRDVAPGAEEMISYAIPAYRLDGWLVYFSAHARHHTLSCPPPTDVFEAFAARLASYGTSKSAIRFPKDRPLPLALVADIVRHRAAENRARAAARKDSRRR